MNLFSIALRNLRKSFSFYGLYFLSVSLVITVFFAFASFSRNGVMMEKISSDGRVETMCRTVSVFLMAFVVFYMSYSNRFFLKRRTKELGIYTLLGYRKASILRLLVSETILICGGGLAAGLVMGALLHKGIVFGITALLRLSIDTAKIPMFNPRACLQTLGFVGIVLLVILLSDARILFRSSLMELIRYEKKSEKQWKPRKLPSFLGLALTLSGYGLALDILRGRDSVWVRVSFYAAGLLTFILVVSGTVLFLVFFLPYAVLRGKRNKKRFYTDTCIITAPGFLYRIRSNAKTLVMLTLLSAGTLTISSVMALSLFYPIASVSRIAPSELEFRLEDEGQEDAVKELVYGSAPGEDVTFTRTGIYKCESDSPGLPPEYSLGVSEESKGRDAIARKEGFECISYSQYIALLQAQKRYRRIQELSGLQENECILVKYLAGTDGQGEEGKTYHLKTAGGAKPVTVKETTLDNPISFANSICTLIVSDALYLEISQNAAPETEVCSINGPAVEGREELYAALQALLDSSPYLQGHSHRISSLFSLNSSTFLLIGFLVVLFFIAAGSILYFTNVSAVSDSKADYEILRKMGYSNRKIVQILRKQTLTFYAVPFCFGLIDCIFATIVYKNGLMQDILGRSPLVYLPALASAALTALIYLLYYFFTVRSCRKNLL